ncbi:hypothetical protein [Mycolicibacterium mucogenicum]|uniref:phage tail protein n=1 Tax=Mycolicibacterium mucogenicum TaxID=56689 RepID=UPI000B1F0EB1|nr:hypothetical protein [Mycolicibacterium mucogenicum]
MTEPAHSAGPVNDALVEGRRKAERARQTETPAALIGLQRAAGNAAVNALLMGKFRAPDKKEIEAALREMRHDEPAVDIVEKGLKAAKSVGVPVELEGPKPPPAALATNITGFGPNVVAPKKPVPPPKPVPAKSRLGAAAAKSAKPAGAGGKGAGPQAVVAPPTGASGAAATPLSADQLLQPPVAPQSVAPHDDPAFTAVAHNVGTFAKDKRAHPTAAAKAKEAQDAALAPTDDVAGQAKAAKVDTMDAQQAGSFDKKAFIAAVKAAIEAKSPKTLKEADNYAKSGKAGEVKGEVKGLVTKDKDGETHDIKAATEAAPDTSKAVAKPVTPMGPEQQGPAPSIPAGGAVPKPAPPEQLNLEAGKQQANQEMADANVDEKQLADSNEPEFNQALADKKEAAAHADTAPAEYRKQEQDTISQAHAEAAAETKAGVTGMQGTKATALAKLVADKGKTKSKDEQKRAEVTAKIQSIFAATEADVKKILDGIDPKVEKEFDQGEAAARKTFETYVSAKMSAYKKDRYGGWLGGLRWAKDKLLGMPSKVNEFYEAGRELYLKQMDTVISRVADIVGNDLTAAKKRIAAGKTEIASYVKSLPAGLQKLGAEASKEINDKFEQLEDEVKSKQEAVVDTLATKYVEARKGLDERIEELQAENKGLVDKAIGAIKAVINTIRKLAAMLMDTLARVAHVVGDIIKHPVRFLGNLVEGIKGGIIRFKDNILTHLRKGLMTWLFGALAEGGIELPDKFDLQGIIKLLASIFGLTWRNIRNRLVKQIGEPAMAAIEKGVQVFQLLASGGVGALWQMLMDKLGDIKEMILEQVKDFVITKIITAGITWLIGLLNPAAAFIKACKLIYDIIMFFVNNAERILKFVNTVIDSAADIVRGNIGGVVAKIEDVLGQLVPILIGFLASVIGIGGIGQKVREIIEKLQKPVTKAIDFVIKTGLKLAGPIIRGLKGIGSKVKAKVAAGKAWAKSKVEAGKQWVKGKLGLGPKGSDEVKATAKKRVLGLLKDGLDAGQLRAKLPDVLAELRPHGLKRLELVGDADGTSVDVMAEASPFDKLVGLIPLYLKRIEKEDSYETKARKPYVTMQITLTLKDSEQQLPKGLEGARPSGTKVKKDDKGLPVKDEQGRYVFEDAVHVMEPAELKPARFSGMRGVSSAQQKSGGLIEVPQRGENQLRMVTFNTAEGSPVASNATHAERQFVDWLRNQKRNDSKWLDRIVAINVDISHSPCSLCTDDVRAVAALTPEATNRTLNFAKPYVDKKRQGPDNRSTTNATLGDIAASGWVVNPKSVAPVNTPDDDKKLVQA